mmetsp:Transcript_41366/g.97236  ORF Transcript_41366/g.97236 Transcript_41366/m.97236 type:complete len:220 (-) Transcript_41366:1476-2135(-)
MSWRDPHPLQHYPCVLCHMVPTALELTPGILSAWGGAAVQLSTEETHPDEGENNEGEHAEEDHICHRREGTDQRIDHFAHPLVSLHQTQRSQSSRQTQDFRHATARKYSSLVDPCEKQNQRVDDIPTRLEVCSSSLEQTVRHDVGSKLNCKYQGEDEVPRTHDVERDHRLLVGDVLVRWSDDQKNAADHDRRVDENVKEKLISEPDEENSHGMVGLKVI